MTLGLSGQFDLSLQHVVKFWLCVRTYHSIVNSKILGPALEPHPALISIAHLIPNDCLLRIDTRQFA
jgi:hypothetical protein